MQPTPTILPVTKEPVSLKKTSHPTDTALPTAIEKSPKQKKTKGKGGGVKSSYKKSKKKKKSKKNVKKKNRFHHYWSKGGAGGKGKGGGKKGDDDSNTVVKWSYLFNDDIFEQQLHEDDKWKKSPSHDNFLEDALGTTTTTTTYTSTEAQQLQQTLQQRHYEDPREPSLTSVFHGLEYLSGNW